MACPYARNNGRITSGAIPRTACPRCGRIRNPSIRCGTSGGAAAAAATAAAARNAVGETICDRRRSGQCANGLVCTESAAAQLYGVTATSEPVYTSCCDACNGCREYRLSQRNAFWPTFARPRWLTCEELYSGQGWCR